MAINKKLIHFNKEDSFTNEKEAGNILDTSIVFVKDAKKIITHSSEYPAVNWGKIKNLFITSEEAKAGDVCFYDSLKDKIRLAKIDNVNITDYPASRFTPIGVVVIPGSHDVYGTGQCGVMSLVEMSCDTPDTGSTDYQPTRWGQYGTDISTLTNFDYAPYVGVITVPGNSTGTIIGQTDFLYMPSDIFPYGIQCPHDTNSYYYMSDTSSYASNMPKAAPSPYLTDGSRNPSYYQISSPSSANNCFSDFNGITNTTTLINLATGQSDWKTASTITDGSGSGYSPSACCCWRFHTDGTKQGDWYLPACGELGYMISRSKAINEVISKITTAYGSSYGVSINMGGEDYYYCSSSEYNSYTVRAIDPRSGYVGVNYKSYCSTRAFLRV